MTFRYQICAIIIMGVFYAVYIGKMLIQHEQGIQTDQIAKDTRNKKRYRIELVMKIATYSIVVVELLSIITGHSLLRYSGKNIGMIIGILGDFVFLAAVVTMSDSWRAGIAADDHRKLVNKGIFRISRNPAFVGFDLVYVGILLMFFNWFLMVITLFAMLMLHLQILQEEKYLEEEFGEDYKKYRSKVCRYVGIRTWKYWVAVCVIVAGLLIGYINYANAQIEKVPELTFMEALDYTTKGNSDAVITVGIIQDGKMSYKVYGEDGRELPDELHTYEIGSLTKTMTAACINKAVKEGKISLDAPINTYLELPKSNAYPTVEELLTHTSGYENYYLNQQMMANIMLDRNPFRFIYKSDILKEASQISLPEETYEWNYSNFGYALLGIILETVYEDHYCGIINQYVADLGMENTAFTISEGDLGHYWIWELTDAYASAGAIRSDISDMLLYASYQLEDETFSDMHTPLRRIDASDEDNTAFDIHIDEIGMAWIIDDENGFVWHNGGTDDYNSYLGFCRETGTAVVIMSNLPDDYRLPATVLGVKLLKELQE